MQENEARTIALHKLAQQLGGVIINSSTGRVITEEDGIISDNTELKIRIEIKTTVSAVPHDTWRDPYGNKFCVWMETAD